MILQLVSADDPVLRTRAEAVDIVPRKLIRDLFETLDHLGGAGLAAPQVGVPLRIAVVHANGHRFVLVNPEWWSEGQEYETQLEGCLSLPGVVVPVERAMAIGLKCYHKAAQVVVGFPARVIQHEVDHLNGILITDYAAPRPEEP